MRRFLMAALVALWSVPALAQLPAVSARTPASRPGAAVPAPAPAPAPAAAPAAAARPAVPMASTKIDINTATAQQLDALPGIGPVRAKKIVEGRPYTDLGDLVTKKVLSQGVFEKARPGMALANINTSSAKDMEKTLPGIGEVRSKAIVAGRPYASPQDLVTKGVLTGGVFDKIKDMVAF